MHANLGSRCRLLPKKTKCSYAHKVTRTPMTRFQWQIRTRLCNFDPLIYIVKLGFTGVYIIFLISAQKHRLWVLVRIAEF